MVIEALLSLELAFDALTVAVLTISGLVPGG